MANLRLIFLIYGLIVFTQAPADNEFGRFYTSPGQRLQMDERRSQRPQQDFSLTIDTPQLDETAPDEETLVIRNSIVVNGLVYRSDGKNTAWLNSNSTIVGSIENQYTRVTEDDIHADGVNITLPDNQSRIELKVGQQYDVHSQQVYELGQQPIKTNTVDIPGTLRQSR